MKQLENSMETLKLYLKMFGLCDWLRAGRLKGRNLSPIMSKVFLRCRDRYWGTLSVLSSVYQRHFLGGVKRPGREANESPETSVDVKNTWIYISNPPYVFMRST
jgi:hypothetical protein